MGRHAGKVVRSCKSYKEEEVKREALKYRGRSLELERTLKINELKEKSGQRGEFQVAGKAHGEGGGGRRILSSMYGGQMGEVAREVEGSLLTRRIYQYRSKSFPKGKWNAGS